MTWHGRSFFGVAGAQKTPGGMNNIRILTLIRFLLRWCPRVPKSPWHRGIYCTRAVALLFPDEAIPTHRLPAQSLMRTWSLKNLSGWNKISFLIHGQMFFEPIRIIPFINWFALHNMKAKKREYYNNLIFWEAMTWQMQMQLYKI